MLKIVQTHIVDIEKYNYDENKTLDDNLKVVATIEGELKELYNEFVEKENKELDIFRTSCNEPNKYSDTVKKRSRTIYELVLDNPYFILGLPLTATYEEALSVKDKIEKFAKLKIAKAYTTEYDLKNIESPNRDLSSIQAATVRIKERKYKWFWFEGTDYSKIWESDKIFEWLDDMPLNIDLLTAAYINLIFTNSEFSNPQNWIIFIKKVEELLSKNDNDLWLQLRNDNRVTTDAVDSSLIKEFRDTFIIPFDQILRTAEYKIIKAFSQVSSKVKIKDKTLKELVQDALVDKTTDMKNEMVITIKNYDDASLDEINEKFMKTISFVDLIGKCTKDIGGTTSTYYKRNCDMYKTILRDVIVFFLDQNELEYGKPFAKKLYPLSDNADKRRLRNSFGYEMFGLKYTDLDADELRQIGLNYHNEGNDYEAYTWLKRAADAGDDSSMLIVALHLIVGDVVPKNIKLAKEYLQKASDLGNIDATQKLLEMYMPHEHYDLGYIYVGFNERKLVEVEVNFIAYVRVMDDYNYSLYVDREAYEYYGGRQTQSPVRIGIPDSGHWHLVIDNDGDEMGDIKSSNCYTRTIPNL